MTTNYEAGRQVLNRPLTDGYGAVHTISTWLELYFLVSCSFTISLHIFKQIILITILRLLLQYIKYLWKG